MADVDDKKFNVRVVISSLGNERRTVAFNELSEKETQQLIATVQSAFNTVRASNSLLLTGSDGQIVIANLDNIVFVEVQID